MGPRAPPAECPCHQLSLAKAPSCYPEPPSLEALHTAPPNPLQPGLVGLCTLKNTPLPRIVSPDLPQQSSRARPLPCGQGCGCGTVESIQVCLLDPIGSLDIGRMPRCVYVCVYILTQSLQYDAFSPKLLFSSGQFFLLVRENLQQLLFHKFAN